MPDFAFLCVNLTVKEPFSYWIDVSRVFKLSSCAVRCSADALYFVNSSLNPSHQLSLSVVSQQTYRKRSPSYDLQQIDPQLNHKKIAHDNFRPQNLGHR